MERVFSADSAGVEERDTLRKYSQVRATDVLIGYQRKKNAESLNGPPTGIFADGPVRRDAT